MSDRSGVMIPDRVPDWTIQRLNDDTYLVTFYGAYPSVESRSFAARDCALGWIEDHYAALDKQQAAAEVALDEAFPF